ncbi:hypothetical protein [Bradyrhizobium sp. CB3481]|uniref:hypothetical protein n=1 Tax=Bradyrhizobium sp. CB3481 TaxID=3039158 RepID=UPI0024B072A9|nr:hypothetical protein [Bradyrhizobium sp. CB3481]WFU19452.1 hypothetical protein QA643_14545 [Bradyrhizobium sp. CB3481]
MLELAGVPYTGAGTLGNGLALDKVITKALMRDRGVPMPNFRVMRRGTESTSDLRFPVVVKRRSESTGFGLQLAHEPAQLRQAVEAIVAQYAQDALVDRAAHARRLRRELNIATEKFGEYVGEQADIGLPARHRGMPLTVLGRPNVGLRVGKGRQSSPTGLKILNVRRSDEAESEGEITTAPIRRRSS